MTQVRAEEKMDYASGANRSRMEGKGRYDLLGPRALRALARHMEAGIVEGGYEARNWEKGLPAGRFFDSAIRHLYGWLEGRTEENHLAAAFWNVHCLIEMLERIDEGLLPRTLLEGLPESHPALGPQASSLKPQAQQDVQADVESSWRRLFWDAEPPTLENVCQRLSREPRYFGHGRFAWSVAAHSLLVASLVAPEHRLAALTHDLGEALTKDQPTNVKEMFPALTAWCERVQGDVLDALGIPRPTAEERATVKKADRTAFAAEVMVLFPADRAERFLAAEEERAGPLDLAAAQAAAVRVTWPDESARTLCEAIEKELAEGPRP